MFFPEKKLFFHLYVFDVSPNHGDHPCQFMTRNQRILVDIFKISFSSFFRFSWLLIDFGYLGNGRRLFSKMNISVADSTEFHLAICWFYQICLHKILSSRNCSSTKMQHECFIQTLPKAKRTQRLSVLDKVST